MTAPLSWSRSWPWSLLLLLAAAVAAAAFVNETHFAVPTGTTSLSMLVDTTAAFASEGLFRTVFPLSQLAVVPTVPVSGGVVRVCSTLDPLVADCARPQLQYVAFPSEQLVSSGDPPFAMANYRAVETTNTSIRLAWDPSACPQCTNQVFVFSHGAPGNALLSEEVLGPKEVKFGQNSNLVVPTGRTSFTVTGLEPFSRYDLVLVTSHPAGAYSWQLAEGTTQPVPIRTRMGVTYRLDRLAQTSIQFAGTALDPVLEEPLQLDAIVASEDGTVFNITGPTELFAVGFTDILAGGNGVFFRILANIQPFTKYTVRVRFVGALGKGPWSDPVTGRTAEAAQPPLQLVLDNRIDAKNIRVSWVVEKLFASRLVGFKVTLFNSKLEQRRVVTCGTDCRHVLVPSARVEEGEAAFATATVTTSFGESDPSPVLPLFPTEIGSDSGPSTATIVLATLIPLCLLAAALAWAIRYYRRREATLALQLPPPDKWELDRETDIQLYPKQELGSGAFGVVIRGKLLRDLGEEPNFQRGAPVAIKMPIPNSSNTIKRSMLEEGRRMKSLGREFHPNVVRLLGVCFQAQPLYIVLELCPFGTVRDYVYKNQMRVDQPQMTRFSLDIATGMAWLAEHSMIHRDLAARNCLVGENHTAKVADFGVCRDIFTAQYYRSIGNTQLPIRWMAPESLLYGHFSSASDVWSFGVTMWEIYSYGQIPYPFVQHDQVREHVLSGKRLRTPLQMHPEAAAAMHSCFSEERPSFQDLVDALTPVNARLQRGEDTLSGYSDGSDPTMTPDLALRGINGSPGRGAHGHANGRMAVSDTDKDATRAYKRLTLGGSALSSEV